MEQQPQQQQQRVREELERRIAGAKLIRPYRPRCHDPGQILTFQARGVWPQTEAEIRVEVLRRIGGGFAGQVYQVRLVGLEGEIGGLDEGGTYAVKILIPPSGFSRLFRDVMYGLAYQGSFSAQVNPDAIEAGALWQRLIRCGARGALGSERAIVNVHATFHDEQLCSFGEISEWVEGRTWRFEVDDRVFGRKNLEHGAPIPADVQSGEYLAKKAFMRRLVRHFHEMGAPELARQYEWWTLKSQPNALKRTDAGDGPADGLTAIDFRAGLALIFGLPMSLGDWYLMFAGLFRGNLVQFDRGDLGKLRDYIETHPDDFTDHEGALAELVRADTAYRASLMDLTHHHVRLLGSDLRRTVREGFVTGWRNQGAIDDEHARKLRSSPLTFLVFFALSFVPIGGRLIKRVWGDASYRAHVWKTLTGFGYFKRRMYASVMAKLIDWHRDERVTGEQALAAADRPVRAWLTGLLFGWMPAKLQRFVTDWTFFKDKIVDTVTHPIKLAIRPAYREEWLVDQVEEGRDDGMLSDAEADQILDRIKDPYIQKYLKSVAAHACTSPITQLVAASVAVYAMIVYGDTWAEGMALAGFIFAVFQGTPISPGSIFRGGYVLFMMIKDRDFKNYWIALAISIWHYVGYLAFPIQMVARYPDLARFMAGNWATKMVRLIPVFGEKGAWLEHFVFDTFFNIPLTFRRWVLGLFGRGKQVEGEN